MSASGQRPLRRGRQEEIFANKVGVMLARDMCCARQGSDFQNLHCNKRANCLSASLREMDFSNRCRYEGR